MAPKKSTTKKAAKSKSKAPAKKRAPKVAPTIASAPATDSPVEKPAVRHVLRVCGPNGESSRGFVWPLEAGSIAEAPDWRDNAECGSGLHGWLDGMGDLSVANTYLRGAPDSKWLVLEVEASMIRELDGKVKFPRATVLFAGSRNDAANFLKALAPASAVNFCTATAGDSGTATAGTGGTATAGYGGTATAGDRGTATAGDGGTATAGDRGTATAGDSGTLIISFWDESAQRYRKRFAEVGEAGIEANVPYVLRNGLFVRKDSVQS